MDVFVCYSRKDSKWRDVLEPHLDSLHIHFGIKYFTDTQIEVGNKWELEISEALYNSRIAIILVSANFLSSDFINKVELPTILDRSAREGLTILPVIVSSCRFNKITKLAQFQTVNDPSMPLDLLNNDGEVNKVFDKLVQCIQVNLEDACVDTVTSSNHIAKQATEIREVKSPFASSFKNREVSRTFEENKYNLMKHPTWKLNMKENDGVFNDQFELQVRREFSSLKYRLSSLNLWVGNTFKEWIKHDPLIYSCDVRIKDEVSILKKATHLFEKGEYDTDKHLGEVIRDLVGARVLVYYPSKIISLHESIINHIRFKVTEVKVHYNEVNPGHLVQNILEHLEPGLEGSYELTEIKNKTGYTGLHYIIAPLPVDECYSNTSLHNCFELQVRTIAQHAWSELQHRAVYKDMSGSDEINKKTQEFEVLADAVESLDRRLDRISTQTIMTASQQLAINDTDEFIETIKQKISCYEKECINEDDRREEGKAFISENVEQFEAINNKTYEYRLQVCEFFLKSCLFKKARDAYLKYVMSDDTRKEYPWALLRFIETSDALAEDAAVQETLNKLTYLLANREITNDDIPLVLTASFFSWKYKNLEQAIALGDKIIMLIGDISEINQHKIYINSCYYRVDQLRKNKKEKDILYTNQQELINEINNLHDKAVNIQSNLEIEMSPDQLDCMAYFEYIFGEIELEEKQYDQATLHNQKARQFIDNCFLHWNKIQVPTIEDQLWNKHRLQIAEQESRIKRLTA